MLSRAVALQVTDTVGVAIQLLAESRLHHLFIVNTGRAPVGVLSLTDVLHFLVSCVDGDALWAASGHEEGAGAGHS